MTDAQHAEKIRRARTALCEAIDNARRDGLKVSMRFDVDDTCGAGDDQGVRDGDFMTEVIRNL